MFPSSIFAKLTIICLFHITPESCELDGDRLERERKDRAVRFRMHSLVCSVISNCTGLPVFCCMTIALDATVPPLEISVNLILTISDPRSLLSIARLNIARSRYLSLSWRRIRIAHISFSLSGGFSPTSFPLFHGTALFYGIDIYGSFY